MSGSNSSNIINRGKINLSGSGSVGMYVKDSTADLENGSSISVAEKGTGVFGEVTSKSGDTTVNIGKQASDNTEIKLAGEKAVGIYLKRCWIYGRSVVEFKWKLEY